MEIKNHWNWDKVTDTFWCEPAAEMYYFVKRWKDLGLINFLDLGCGIGRHALFFAENGFDVTGLDSSESGLIKLNKLSKEKKLGIKTVLAEAKKLPFKDNSFNSIVAYHSIYHTNTEDMSKIIKQIERILKTNGEIYLTYISKNTYSFTAPECKYIDQNVRLKKEGDGNVLPHYFVDYSDIEKLLSNFEIIKAQHIEDIFNGKSSWHYYIHARKI